MTYSDIHYDGQASDDAQPLTGVVGPFDLTTLDLANATAVVLRGEGWEHEHLATLRAQLPSSVFIISLAPGDSLDALNEDDMRAAGWVRAE